MIIFWKTKGNASSFATSVCLRLGKRPQHLWYKFRGPSQENLVPGVTFKKPNWMKLWGDEGGRK